MSNRQRTVAQVSQALLDELTEKGTRDLTATRLSQIEEAVYGLVDEVTERVVRGVLEDQAGQSKAIDTCPRCGGGFEDQEDQAKSLKLRRGQVEWQQPVKRCPRCRRDFFPSGEGVGM